MVGDICGETEALYLRGLNLIHNGSSYYLFNAHADVVNLTNASGTVTKTYSYDAFGVEKNPSETDTNHFRYCGEYWDTETETYYLRARYYDPALGRFTQQDTHWNTANMIYGDNPQKINEREDRLGLKSYSFAPQISAVLQSGNLYVYCVNNPVLNYDPTGKIAVFIITGIVGAVVGGAIGAIISHNNGEKWWKGALIGAGIGGAVGAGGGLLASYALTGSVTASTNAVVSGAKTVTITLAGSSSALTVSQINNMISKVEPNRVNHIMQS